MLSAEAQQNQSQQTTLYDERVFNERIRQLFDSIDEPSISPPNKKINQMTSIVDALFPEQASNYQQQSDQRRSSTNDLSTTFDRFSLWNTNTNGNSGSASAFCGGTASSGSATFANRRQSTLHSSSRSLRNTYHHQQPHHHHHHQQQQQQQHHRPPPVTRPRFTASSIRLPSASVFSAPNSTLTHGLQRSSSSLSTNNTSATTDYHPRFASRLSTTRLPTTAPVGSHDQIGSNNCKIDPIAPSSSLIDTSDPTCSLSAVISRNSSSSNVQPQQYVTMTQTTTTTFCYVPASGSLVYNNSTGASRSTTVGQH